VIESSWLVVQSAGQAPMLGYHGSQSLTGGGLQQQEMLSVKHAVTGYGQPPQQVGLQVKHPVFEVSSHDNVRVISSWPYGGVHMA